MIDELKKQLTKDEGRVRWVYKDSRGLDTIGIGILVDQKGGGGLRDNEIDFIFNNRVAEVMAELSKQIPWTNRLDDVRKGALLNMCFQLGVAGLKGFPKMLSSMQFNNFNGAYLEALDSDWARQTPARAKRIAQQILTGEWQYG